MIKQILKKYVLIIIGLFLSLLFLETAMWTGGFVLSGWQTYQNKKVLKKKSQYHVMCIGESTTAGEYPVQLQKILNKQYPDKFSIIDCGIGGSVLTTIFESLDNNIQQYHPDIVVCMMGINNGFGGAGSINEQKKISNKTVIEKTKLYKLFKLLQQHLESLKEIDQRHLEDFNVSEEETNDKDFLAQTENITESYFRLGMDAWAKQEYQNAEKIFKNVLKIDPNHQNAYFWLFSLYDENKLPITDEDKYKMAVKALELGFTHEAGTYYKTAIVYNINKGDTGKAKEYVNLLFERNPINLKLFFFLLYKYVKPLMTPEQNEILLKQISEEKTGISYGSVATFYAKQKDYDKAEKYFKLAEDFRIIFPNEETNKLYRLIVQKLIDNNIKVICMQYPVRSIKPLQNILKDTPYYDKITFVSNEEIFKQALREKTYNEIFCDQFGGDFGHCIDGDSLIAENIAKTLIKITKPND